MVPLPLAQGVTAPLESDHTQAGPALRWVIICGLWLGETEWQPQDRSSPGTGLI